MPTLAFSVILFECIYLSLFTLKVFQVTIKKYLSLPTKIFKQFYWFFQYKPNIDSINIKIAELCMCEWQIPRPPAVSFVLTRPQPRPGPGLQDPPRPALICCMNITLSRHPVTPQLLVSPLQFYIHPMFDSHFCCALFLALLNQFTSVFTAFCLILKLLSPVSRCRAISEIAGWTYIMN